MKKNTLDIAFFCQSCGHSEKKWFGRCPGCGEWNTMVEEKFSRKDQKTSGSGQSDKPESITAIEESPKARRPTGIEELDRVLGGGLVSGSVTLLGGEPGAGKSTLLQMTAQAIAAQGHRVLYISGEESKEQIRLSALRLGCLHENFYLLTQTDLNLALERAKEFAPDFLVIDSVQTVASRDLESAAGSVAQIREVTAKVVHFAKNHHVPTFLVGHVTKDGAIAGPRLLEHMVDTVLYFEQSRNDQYRMLRAHKNRFGSTNEIGLFEMSGQGLKGIQNPSSFFLAERPKDKPGSAVFCAMEGSRPLLVEIQALAVETLFGNPRRTCIGIDQNRVSVIAAVLEKHAAITLSRMDLFVSVAGGIDIKEPAVDLAVALAICSSVRNVALPFDMIACGELGLSGEIRSTFRIHDRLKEAERLGFTKGLIPKASLQANMPKVTMTLRTPGHVDEALRLLID